LPVVSLVLACVVGSQPAVAGSLPQAASGTGVATSQRTVGIAVADRLLHLQNRSGAIADSPGGRIVNVDSNMEYALWGLAAAYRATGAVRFLHGLRRGVSWLADRMVMAPRRWRGSFWYGYRSQPPFTHVRVSPGGNVADVRGVDATSTLFVYDLWLYTKLSGSHTLARRLRTRALAAVDFVIANNQGPDGFFSSSWQRRKGSRTWHLWRYQYSADQGDVRLGMTAAARLYGTQRHRRVGRMLARTVPQAFFLPQQHRFALGRQGGSKDAAWEGFDGVFPQGYLPWVFPGSPQTRAAATWLAGCVDVSGAPRCREGTVAYSLSAAVLRLGQHTGTTTSNAALHWLEQHTFHPTTGAVGDSDRHPGAEYSNVDGFSALALLGPPAHPFGW